MSNTEKNILSLTNQKIACMDYKIKTSYQGSACFFDVDSKDSCFLTLLPGNVVINPKPRCLQTHTTMTLPACASVGYSVFDAKLDHEVCEVSDNCCIWTNTVKQSNKCTVKQGDAIVYTITFTNYSNVDFETVSISDVLPNSVQLIKDSITPQPKQGETLQNGISMGKVIAGNAVKLSYCVIVKSTSCEMIKNTAQTMYTIKDCSGCILNGISRSNINTVKIKQSTECNPCVVHAQCKSLLRFACNCFCIGDMKYINNCYVYSCGAIYLESIQGKVLSARYGIWINYVDCNNTQRNKSFENIFNFSSLPYDFNPSSFDVTFDIIEYCIDGCGLIKIAFQSELRYIV